MLTESSGCPLPHHRRGVTERPSCSPGRSAQPGAEGTTAASAGEQRPAVQPGREVDQACFLWKPHLQEKGGPGWYNAWAGRGLAGQHAARLAERCGSALSFPPAGTIAAACGHLQNAFHRRRDPCRQCLAHPQSLARASRRRLQGPATTMDLCSCFTPKARSLCCQISDSL